MTAILLIFLWKYFGSKYMDLYLLSKNPNQGYLQPLDLLYNAACKLKFNLEIEDYLVGLHMDNKKLGVEDEKAAEIATKVYYEMSKNIIQEKGY